MENIEEEMHCPICKIVVMSDADALKYCKICGMNITYNPILVKRHNRKFYFCSEHCKTIFLKVGFKSFRLHNIHEAI